MDLLFAMNQAYGHLRPQAGNNKKTSILEGRFLDCLWDGIWEHVGVHFGSIWGPIGRQIGEGRRSKSGPKKGSQKSNAGVRDCSQNLGCGALKTIRLRGSQESQDP